MFQLKKTLLLIAALLLSINSFYSQISITPTAGCSPLAVTCSGPAGATNVFWSLGGTAGTSSLTVVNPIYNSPGTYNITYTAIVGGSPVNYSKQLVVTGGPSGNFSFSAPANRCKPLAVSYNCTGGNPGSNYVWDFGDFVQGIGSTQTHTYNVAGNFVPVVVITDAVTGCSAVATPPTNNTISVSDPPNVIISSSKGFVGCVPPFTTAITGSLSTSGSPKPGPLSSFVWSFGGGAPASSGNITPGVVTFPQGTHPISLKVTDNNNCSNTATTLVSVENPSLVVVPVKTICINSSFPLTINSNLSNITFTVKGMGQMTNTVIPGTPHYIDSLTTLSTPGFVSFTVSVSAGSSCIPLVVIDSVFVEHVVPSFTATPLSSSCMSPMLATYVSQSSVNNTSSLSYTWSSSPTLNAANNIYDPTTNTPIGTFTLSQGSKNHYTMYNYYFMPKVYLKVQSNSIAQCSAITWTVDLDTLMRPTAYFNVSKREGCVPQTIKLRDSSFTYSIYPIATYTWCDGAIPPTYITGVGNKPLQQSFSYTTPGVYRPYLVITTNNGCVDTSFKEPITIVNSPTISGVSFIPPLTSTCAGHPVTIKMAVSPTTTPIDHWHVDTDKHMFSGCITDSTPTFPFSHVGTFGFTVSAYQSGCKSTSVMPQVVTIKGPYSKFRFETNCDVNKKSVNFYSELQQVQTATLYFGDNTYSVIPGNQSAVIGNTIMAHIYPSRGNYTATIVSENGISGCAPHSFSMQVKIREPRARITFAGNEFPALPTAVACTKSPYLFNGNLSTDVYANCCRGYAWSLSTPNYTLPPIDVRYSTFALFPSPWFGTPYGSLPVPYLDPFSKDTFRVAGIYTITLMIKDENGCTDTTTRNFRIGNAEPSFTFNVNPLCLSDTLRIINTTQANQVSPDAITNYTWSFGENPPTVITSTNPLDNPKHKYLYSLPPTQTVNVMCIAVNGAGCRDTAIKALQINNPIPNFRVGNPLAQSNIICIPKNTPVSTNFTANTGFTSYSISYGQPTVSPVWVNLSSFNNITHAYNTPGIYTPTLQVTDNRGCKASEIVTITAYGQPTANLAFIDGLNKFCQIGTPTIASSSSINVTPITKFVWSIGSAVGSGNDTITPIISNLGIHKVQLVASINGYCASTATSNLYVFNPRANMNLDRDTFCLGEEIKVSLLDTTETGVVGWQWFFGDNVPQPNILAGSFLAVQNKTLSYVYNVFPPGGSNGFTTMYLLYYSAEKACIRTATAGIQVIKIDADFIQSDSLYKHCLGIPDKFISTTPNPVKLDLLQNWEFEANTSIGAEVNHIFKSPGVYPVNLKVLDRTYNCRASATKNMTIFPLPTANFSVKDTSCPNERFIINGSGQAGISGAISGTISPLAAGDTLKFTPENTFSVYASAPITTEFTLNVKDNNNCVSKNLTELLYVQQPAPLINWDTTVVIGETIPLNSYAGFGFTYTWTPLIADLNCTNCIIPNPISTSTVNVTYSVIVEDGLHCSAVNRTYKINILPKTSVDVPSAFTPNGDGINDLIYADGWGIRTLNYFKIFNRWGQLVFETTDVKVGWDGMYNGNLQNMETYVFQVSVETYTNETLTKSGTFKLIR